MERFNILAFLVLCSLANAGKKCLSGPYHKKFSSAEGPDYAECHKFKNNSCCTADFTKRLREKRVDGLYNFTYDHCAEEGISQTTSMSKGCVRFMLHEECFYQCEPTLIKYQNPTDKSGAIKVPICASYCDAWFDACKDDQTCVKDWLTGFVYIDYKYKCPQGSKCKTFSEIYENGKGLCNTIWGDTFFYQTNKTCYPMGSVKKENTAAVRGIENLLLSLEELQTKSDGDSEN